MDAILMEMAHLMSLRGTCSRAQVGCVVARDGRVCATGYNGAPAGLEHCLHPPGELSVDQPSNAPACTWSIHAEANAVAFAARYGVALQDATLYTTMSPCVPCAQLAINAGITRVVYAIGYRNTAGLDLLTQADVQVSLITDLALGAPIEPGRRQDPSGGQR